MNKTIFGDCRETMRQLIADGVRVQCAVTSPPYWGLRDYGTAQWEGGDAGCGHIRPPLGGHGEKSLIGKGERDIEIMSNQQYRDTCGKCGAKRIDAQLGLEPVHDCLGWATKAPCGECYVCHMVEVFRLVRELLADDGTCWVNIGDSYVANGIGQVPQTKQHTGSGFAGPNRNGKTGLKAKDLCGIPWRVALALQADGWYLRSEIIWAKPNPMPESVTDRPTKAHEQVFLLTKSASYFYDAEAIKEPAQEGTDLGLLRGKGAGGPDADKVAWHAQSIADRQAAGIDSRTGNPSATRNKRTVWTVATSPYSGAHFATFPPKLIEPMILAGTSERGRCPECFRQWVRVVESSKSFESGSGRSGNAINGKQSLAASPTNSTPDIRMGPVVSTRTTGWDPGCKCGTDPESAVVFDPFMGSGTVGQVAQHLGRRWLGCDLNDGYHALQQDRTRQHGLAL